MQQQGQIPCLPGKRAARCSKILLRKADSADIERINSLIAAAMDTWQLADRVKRISLPLYRYHAEDLVHMQLMVAHAGNDKILGVAALEESYSTDILEGLSILILHGIYVAPDCYRQSVGSQLLEKVEDMAMSQGSDALLVKARPEAISFFKATGFEELSTRDRRRDYPYQLCKRFPRVRSIRSNPAARVLIPGQE